MAMTLLTNVPFTGANGSTTFTDTTGNQTWTAVGNAQIQGNALSLDGTGDGASTPGDNFRLGSWDFRVGFDMKQPAGSGYKVILDFIQTAIGSMWTWQVYTSNGILHWNVYNSQFGNPSVVQSTARVDDDVWHTILFERLAGVLTLYIDGVAVASASDTRAYETIPLLVFGGHVGIAPPAYEYTGLLRNLSISSDVPEFNGVKTGGPKVSIIGLDLARSFEHFKRGWLYEDWIGEVVAMPKLYGPRVTRGVPPWWGPPYSTSQLPTYKLRGRVMQRDPDGIIDDYPVGNIHVALYFRKLHALIDIQRSDEDGYVQFDNLMPGNQAYYGIAFDSEFAPLQNSIIWDRLSSEPGP